MSNIFQQFSSSFDDTDDFQPTVLSPERAVEAVAESLEEDTLDEELKEAEKLLAKAAYYKVIAINGVIEDDGTSQAAEVNAESRLWARQQMARMLGRHQEQTAPAKVESPFNEKETMALKKLAALTLAKMGETATEPTVKKVETKPAGPTVRRIQAPKTQTPSKPSAPAKPQQAAPTPAAKPKAAKGGKKSDLPHVPVVNGEPDYDTFPSKQPFIDVDGAVCKMVDNPRFDPSIEGSKPRTKMKVSNQVRAAGAGFPPPTKDQMQMLSQAQSMETINSGTSASATSPFGYDKEASQDIFIAAAAGSINT